MRGGESDEAHVFDDEITHLKVPGKTGCKMRTPGLLKSRGSYFHYHGKIFTLKIILLSIFGYLVNRLFPSVPVGMMRKGKNPKD